MFDRTKLTQGKQLTPIEIQVLEYIIENIDTVMQMGVRTIAKNNFTSTSTIMRLTKKLGYTGFVDMHYKLAPLIKNIEITEENETHFTSLFSGNKILEQNQLAKIEALALQIYDMTDQFIFIYATGFSSILAEYLYKKLLVLGKKSLISSGTDSGGILENNINDIGLFIAISKSGETLKVLEKTQIAKENGIKTVSFTKETSNSIAMLTDMNFKIEDHNKLDDRNTLPNPFFPSLMMLFEILVYEYHHVILQKNKANI